MKNKLKLALLGALLIFTLTLAGCSDDKPGSHEPNNHEDGGFGGHQPGDVEHDFPWSMR